MTLNLEKFLPNINTGLSKIGFFFGAGTSKEAGYPLTKELTLKIYENMDSDEKELLKSILQKENITYNFENGIPDIEEISDAIYKNKGSTNFTNINNLEQSIKKKIYQEFIPNSNLNLEYHIKFLRALKVLMTNKAESIWIITTNYDLLFEMAAMQTKIPIFNGFEGILYRYFTPERLNLSYGNINGRTFNIFKEPHIKILKLHGSISWYKDGENIYESYRINSVLNEDYTMILPRRVKTLDALNHPYDILFRHTLQCLGRECMYLISCGYSFRDEHINDTIIIPKLRDGKVRFTALFNEEPTNIERFREFKNFNYITKDKLCLNGTLSTHECDVWKFSEFVKLFIEKAGIS